MSLPEAGSLADLAVCTRQKGVVSIPVSEKRLVLGKDAFTQMAECSLLALAKSSTGNVTAELSMVGHSPGV